MNILLLETTKPKTFQRKILQKLVPKIASNNYHYDALMTEIQARVTTKYDLAYFPSAHMMKRPELKIPVVGTLHDFNWKYFFGQQIFTLPFVEMMDEEILRWMSKGYNACSSQDVVDEAKKLYPNAQYFPTVIPIGSVVVNRMMTEERSNQILKQLGIDFPYLIFPGNFFPHKNHLNLFAAFSILRQRKGFGNYKLLLTGFNSDQVKRGIAGKRGVQILTKNSMSDDFDVVGLGYQPNEVIDVLISKARLLVSPSLYEAICTPGMDAWSFGTPTAISDIPPFREHEKVWGIRSAFFDPNNPEDIANTIEHYLNHYEQAKIDGEISKQNLRKYSWSTVAERYMEVFRKAVSDFEKG